MNHDSELLLDKINSRKEILDIARQNLKTHFIGLDDQIDRIVNTIETWYIMPELITRPVIVNIWGMTGTGKTDLIRRLAKELSMLNKFFELQMDTKKSSWVRTIEGALDMAEIEEGEPAIVLFDELQRFRTKDNSGDQIDNDVYQDIWMLLSDGKFANQAGKQGVIQELYMNLLYEEERDRKRKEKEEKEKDKSIEKDAKEEDTPVETEENYKYKTSFWSAKNFKRKLKLRESVSEIMKWSVDEKMDKIKEATENDTISEGSDFSKLLIFVCGNIDEAYSMAQSVGEADIDADTFHEFSKKINVASIKDALNFKFAPEQIARLGNNHVIYPSLSKKSYEIFIKRHVDSIIKKFEEISNVNITVDNEVYSTIYRNGVFPAQGMRPVFTSISSLIESNIPSILVTALQRNINNITITFEDSYIHGKHENESIISKKIKLDSDESKKGKCIDALTKTAVHEAGHVVTYICLHGVVPTQVDAASTSTNKSGFMMSHIYNSSKDAILSNIAILYAGRCAEELVFGKDHVSSGAFGDIKTATACASEMIREYEMSDLKGFYSDGNANSYGHVLHIPEQPIITKMISEILSRGSERAFQVLKDNVNFHMELTQELIDKKKLNQEQLAKIAEKHGIKARCESSKYLIIHDFNNKFNEYVQRNKKD